MHSCIYEGSVVHHRQVPHRHRFRYPLYMFYLDLAELDTVFKGRLLWSTRRPALARFRREDHFGDPEQSLDEAIRNLVAEREGWRPSGPIRLLTHLRMFGYVMNPVVFYYCFDADDQQVEAIVADVSNTPWDERHQYVLVPGGTATGPRPPGHSFHFDKQFHVSPFMQMEQTYHWTFSEPDERLAVTMRNLEAGASHFHAVLKLTRTRLTGRALARLLLVFPPMSMAVVARIYWQAFRLWLKRTPYVEHPKYRTDSTESVPPVSSQLKEYQRA